MEMIYTAVNEGRKAGVRRMQKHSLKTDMTPMVDLGFLLITFFVITAELSKPIVMNLYMPDDGKPMPVANSKGLTFLLGGNNHIFYYSGEETEALKNASIYSTTYTGIGNVIREKQKMLDSKQPDGRNELVVLIKADKAASYKNVVDALDEMTIHGVTRYALVKPGEAETKYIQVVLHFPLCSGKTN
jgi:biopolymer transport protein ExbD